MKPQVIHAHEDRLLDFAYGELQPAEARVVEQHLEGCARCAEALADIRGVRTSMSRLSLAPAPDAGLESLLAYAQQSARRAAAGPAPRPSWWRRWLVPAVGLAAVSVFGIVVHRASTQVAPMDISPTLPLEAKKDEAPPPPPASPAVAQAPMQEQAAQVSPETQALHAQRDEEFRLAQEKTKEVRRRGSRSDDWSNVGSGGGFPAKKRESYAARDERKQVEAGENAAGLSSDFNSDFKESGKPQAVARAEPAPTPAEEAEAPVIPGESQQAVMYEESRGPQQGRTSSSLGAVASSPSTEAAPPTAQPLPAPTAPAPAAAAAPEGYADAMDKKTLSLPKSAPAKTAPSRMKKAAPTEPSAPLLSSAELSREARQASRDGNRAREASLLRAALEAGARGSERVDLLSRLCEAEAALGRREAAVAACSQVVAEDPDSRAASLARRRLEQL
jgi:hypothetical protein